MSAPDFVGRRSKASASDPHCGAGWNTPAQAGAVELADVVRRELEPSEKVEVLAEVA